MLKNCRKFRDKLRDEYIFIYFNGNSANRLCRLINTQRIATHNDNKPRPCRQEL